MESFPWWSDDHKKLAQDVRGFVDEVLPRDVETRWRRQFPWDIFQEIARRGYTGAGVPKEYGGLGLGATGACIAAEELNRMPGVGRVFVGSMLGGLRQIIDFGNQEQKKRFLPRFAGGEVGAIVITEPFVGTDAAAIETTARRDGGSYVINGKKRYIVSAGLARRYMVYARTSDSPEEVRRHRHLTAFVVERGTPGFHVEKINEIMGFENIQNGVLDFDQVSVPAENRIGEEGDGWRVMTAGLNFERTLIAAQNLGWFRELLGTAVPYAQRRVQFGKPTIDLVNNQLKVADLVLRTRMARLITYYTAYLWDLGWDITLESNIAKIFNCEGVLAASLDAIQVMGGDGVTPFYTPAEIFKLAKVENISGGTMEALRLVIYRTALRTMAEDLKMPRRIIHEELGVPIPVSAPPEPQKEVDEEKLLAVLAEDYRANPGLYMSREDLQAYFPVSDERLDQVLLSLEKTGLCKLYRSKKGVALAKATYDGLKKANPPEHYRWFPDWVRDDDVF